MNVLRCERSGCERYFVGTIYTSKMSKRSRFRNPFNVSETIVKPDEGLGEKMKFFDDFSKNLKNEPLNLNSITSSAQKAFGNSVRTDQQLQEQSGIKNKVGRQSLAANKPQNSSHDMKVGIALYTRGENNTAKVITVVDGPGIKNICNVMNGMNVARGSSVPLFGPNSIGVGDANNYNRQGRGQPLGTASPDGPIDSIANAAAGVIGTGMGNNRKTFQGLQRALSDAAQNPNKSFENLTSMARKGIRDLDLNAAMDNASGVMSDVERSIGEADSSKVQGVFKQGRSIVETGKNKLKGNRVLGKPNKNKEIKRKGGSKSRTAKRLSLIHI